MKFFRRLFSREDYPVAKLEKATNYRFKNREIIKIALSHRSSLKDTGLGSNERLEFLGDAVLGLIVSNFLYNQNKDLSEGDLTRMKATLVNETTLTRAAMSFNLGDYIFLSIEEEKSGGRYKPSIIADAFEAIIGAIYLDGGFEAAEKFVMKYILDDYLYIVGDEMLHNFKGELLEYMQSRSEGMPHYRVSDQFGPDHDKVFRVGVYANNVLLGEGEGKSKKEAEQQAARKALQKINERQS